MKKIISAVLVALMLLGSGSALTYSALNTFFEYTPPTPESPPPDGGGGGGGGPNTLVVPAYRDYGRGTIDFDKIVYSRPDMERATSEFNSLSLLVDENELSFEEQLAAITETDDVYFEISSMYSYANIMTNKNTRDAAWQEEYRYINVNYPKFSQAVEKLFVSCARSEHGERFEEEYFGEGLIEKYSDGGSYSDSVVALMAAEAELEAEYSSLGISTVTISHNGSENTAEYFINYYYDLYGKNPNTEDIYIAYVNEISSLYYDAYHSRIKPIYLNLLKTRRLIADELSLESYSEYAYGAQGHDYSEAQMVNLLDEIADYIVPLYRDLAREVISTYKVPSGATNIHKNDILNTLYDVYKSADSDLSEAFSYMLQHGLYDIEKTDFTRYSGAFTVYIDSYNAPFIFVSTRGSVLDYFTVTHEFGHFFDSYINYGASSSLDLAEISSQALELLTITMLNTALSREIVNYLIICQIDEILSTLTLQSFYATFEHKAYGLEYDEITEENLNAILRECEEKYGFISGAIKLHDIVSVPHIVLYPYYVQSYCTSALASLQIYFCELDESGSGLTAYKELVSKDGGSTFEKTLSDTGLDSPFESGFIINTVNRIYRLIYGVDYFKPSNDANAA